MCIFFEFLQLWAHRSGEFFKERPVVLYEYQKTRHHEHPEKFYKDYKGVLVTDGLNQYHLIEKNLKGLINANCWAHARRAFSDAVKAMPDKESVRLSTAYQAIVRISAIYKPDEILKDLDPEIRLKGNVTADALGSLLPWSKDLPDIYHKTRR